MENVNNCKFWIRKNKCSTYFNKKSRSKKNIDYKIVINIDYKPSRKTNVFDEMIADIMANKKFQAIIKELFIRCRKYNISVLIITLSYFSL